MTSPSAKLCIGFTGTRNGGSREQLHRVRQLVNELLHVDALQEFQAHHGDCIGADAEFHRIVRPIPGSHVVVHPGPAHDVARQAGCVGDDRMPNLPHMRRNLAIVMASSVMIATPFEDSELQWGGTWRTVAMARRERRPLAIIRRDGGISFERWS